MAEILIHAGMPKTGSTSLQRWLIDNAERLQTQRGVQMLVATNRTRRNPTRRVQVEPYESGTVNSGLVVRTWGLGHFAPEVPLRFLAELDELATQLGNVLVTGEGLSKFLWTVDAQVLAGFQALARGTRYGSATTSAPNTPRSRRCGGRTASCDPRGRTRP